MSTQPSNIAPYPTSTSVRCLITTCCSLLLMLVATSTLADSCTEAYGSTAKDYDAILQHCQPAARSGDIEAAFRTGEAFQYTSTGTDTKKNRQTIKQALHWYEVAAEQGHPLAQRNLATLYSNGEGIPRDHFKAYHWYKRAAAQGQSHSQLMLGMMYLYGEGTVENKEQALYWIESAAQNGEPYAQYMYGKILFPLDPDTAINWYRKAAAQNNEYALYRLGVLYYHGEHVTQDYPQALSLAERAIAAGHSNGRILRSKVLEVRPGLASKNQSEPADRQTDSDTPATAAVDPAALGAAATPASEPSDNETDTGAAWLMQQPPGNFSIQLAIMKELSSIERFFRWYGLTDNSHYYRSQFNAGNLYVLLYGSYRSQREAQAAINRLPEKVKAMKPWVRSLGTLQNSYRAVP